jgi:hypothetical protein
MRFFISILLIALFAFALGFYMPWWSIAVASFVVSLLIRQRSGRSFLTGFLAVFIMWCILGYLIDVSNHQLLSARIASILPLGGSPVLLIFFTGVIGGLTAGMASLTASYLHRR